MPAPSAPTCFLLAVAAGFALYQFEQDAQRLDRGIARTLAAVEQERAKIVRRQAQWAMLTEGDRLAGLARQHLAALAPVRLDQVVTLTELGQRLPPPPAVPAVVAYLPVFAAGAAPAPWQRLLVGR